MINMEEYNGLYYNEINPDIGTNFAESFKLPFAGTRG